MIVEQEEQFYGVPLSKLTEIAEDIERRNYCTVDQYGFLVFHYKSNRGHQTFQRQMSVDENLKLFDMNGGPVFPGQRYSHANEFVRRVNESVKFVTARK